MKLALQQTLVTTQIQTKTSLSPFSEAKSTFSTKTERVLISAENKGLFWLLSFCLVGVFLLVCLGFSFLFCLFFFFKWKGIRKKQSYGKMQNSSWVDVWLSPTHLNQTSFLGSALLSKNQLRNISLMGLVVS